MKIFLLFTAAVFLTFIVNAQGLQDFTSFGIDGVYGEEVTDGNALVLKLVVPADASNPWDAQLITPSFRGLEGQHEGASFCLSFDYKGSTDDGVFRIFSGATYPYDPTYNQGGSTQIVDDLGTPIVWGVPNVSVSTDWQHYDYDYYLGAEGADSVRLQINCGLAGASILFKNFVLKIDGKVVHTWYGDKLVKKNGISYCLNSDGTAEVVSSYISGAASIESTIADGDQIYTVTSVASNAFSNCSDLTSVTIPNSVTSIGFNAFNKVANINYNGTATGAPWGALTLNGKVFEYPIDVFIAFGDGVYGEEVTDGNAVVLKLVVPAGTFEKWDAQLITPSFRGLEGQEEGASFCLSFDYKGSTDDGVFSIFSGATYPYDPVYNQGGSTQIVDDLGTPIVWGVPNVSVSTDWQHYDYDYYLGAEGADSVRLQINCGLAGASILFKNFVLKIDGKVVHTWYGDKLVKKNGITYSLNSDGTAEVVSSYTSGAASIESTIADGDQIYTVTSVASNAFSNCSDLTSVTIPNSVTSIGERAFYGVANINYNGTATFAEWDQNWGAYVLNGTIDGDYVYADAGKTVLARYVGMADSETIPSLVTSIGDSAFINRNTLTSVIIPNSVANIGFNAFENCNNLTIYCEAKSKPAGWSAYWNFDNRPVVWNYKNGNGDESGTSIHHTDTLYIYTSSVDTLYIFNSDTIFSIVHDTLHSIAYDTIFAVSRDTVFVIAQTPKNYTLTATSANPQMGFAIGNGSYNENYVAEIAAISYYGYHFTKWSDGNVNNPRFESVTKNCNFVAEFEVNNYSVMADANDKSMGKVEGAAEYAYLSRTQLKAVAKNGYRFSGWSDGETENPREILVYSDTSFTAMFESNTFKSDDLYYNILSQKEPYAVEVTYDRYVQNSKGIVTMEEPSKFANNYSGLVNVVIPSSVTYNGIEYAVIGIGDSAFYECSTIKSVTIPKSVTRIGKDTFNGCSVLTIQCEMPQKPESWADDWDSGCLSIVWNATGINADAIQSANIYAHHNVIVVENTTDEISVFDAMGRCVAKRQADSDRTMIAMPRQGLYIVKVGTIVKKVFVE